ncbi:hypothetical protein FACS189437_08430 [Bacteroidia bacterium]|nr:hypothetical protein FACS189437_08430 [Bacteroidia bacterium]
MLDTHNEPLIGASVVLKGKTSVGASTDLDGKFTLKIPTGNQTIVVSLLGMKPQEVNVGSRDNISVILEENEVGLQEVVVVGFGQQKKESVVGAITQTSGKVLERAGGVSSIGAALTGNLPGVVTTSSTGMPGEEDPQILIRGRSSWNNANPLILVDGIERDMTSVDINSVESVSVLKDASATAVFGVRGANGVVLITTKRGKEGKATINANVSSTVKTPSQLPSMYDAYDDLAIRNRVIESELGLKPEAWAYMTPQAVLNKYRYPANTEEWERYPNVNWRNELLKDYAMSYNANVDITGGTSFVKYFTNIDFLNEGDLFKEFNNSRGYQPGYGFNRINVRSNLDFTLTKSTTMRLNLSGSHGVRKKPNNRAYEWTMWGTLYGVAPDVFRPQYSDGVWGYYKPSPTQVSTNSVQDVALNGIEYITNNRLYTDFQLEQDLGMFLKGLKIRGLLSFDNTFEETGRGINDTQHWVPTLHKWIDPETGEVYYDQTVDSNNKFDFQDGIHWYGRGIWAPAFVYHKGMFYIFANVNRHTVQIFQTDNPAGKWKHHVMKRGLHDLGVFFDDDDKKYVVWGAGTITLAELNDDLTDIKPETQKTIATGVGEGSHVYKIDGKYVIIWAVPGATTPMQCGIADKIEGPYEVRVVSEKDHQGYLKGLTLHQGGIIQTPLGEWWGYSMQDRDGIGRMTNLAPVTWHEGFPYFGLPGNLTKTPRTWIKPDMGKPAEPITPAMPRSDNFDNPKPGIQWGWNHLPDDSKWSLTENPGKLRLHSLPAESFWYAKNTLTQKAIGPDSYASVSIDASALKEGDIAGLALLTSPYAWLGIEKTGKDYQLTMYKQAVQSRRPGTAEKAEDNKYTVKLNSPHIRLKVHTDFVADVARFSYNAGDGGMYYPIGETVPLHFTMTTFQGIRYALFHFNIQGINGGYADFDDFTVEETYPHGFRSIPYAKTVLFKNKAENASFLTIQGMDEFFVDYCKQGRVALRANDGSFVSVDPSGTVSLKKGKPDTQETFQWIELDDGSVALLSLATNRYLTVAKGNINALTNIPAPDRKDGASFDYVEY